MLPDAVWHQAKELFLEAIGVEADCSRLYVNGSHPETSGGSAVEISARWKTHLSSFNARV